MSFLSVVPEILSAATGNLRDIGSGLRAASAAAAPQTTAIAAPAVDEVSTAVSAFLGAHAQQFQSLTARAATFHDDFVKLLRAGAAQYVNTDMSSAQAALGSAEPVTPAGIFNSLTSVSTTSNFGPFALSSNMGPGIFYQALTLNSPFGPLGSLSAGAASIVPSEFAGFGGLAADITGSVNTPIGPFNFFKVGGSHLVTATGGFATSVYYGSDGVAVNGSLPWGITGGSITTMGLQFWFQDREFGINPLFLNALAG